MYSDVTALQGLRFKVQVPKADYRTLVARLRGEDGTDLSGTQRPGTVTAVLDLAPTSNSLLISQLGEHRLPKAISIRAGSPTHILLMRSLLAELEITNDPELTERLNDIIKACKEQISVTKLRVTARDFELTTELSQLNANKQPSSARFNGSREPRILSKPISTNLLFDLDDTPTLVVPPARPTSDPKLIAEITTALTESYASRASISGNSVEISFKAEPLNLPDSISIQIYTHWGSYEELSDPWQDELLINAESKGENSDVTHIDLSATLHAPIHGSYGASFYVTINSSAERLWLGRPSIDDLKFKISQDDPELNHSYYQKRYSAVSNVSNRARELEVVFATPEGPHAAAGGLAHVITGLPPELTALGMPVTIIAPLYRHANGNKHRSAEEVLNHGINLGGVLVKPHYVTTVSARIGPTHFTGTGNHKRPPTSVPCKVYIAENGPLRLVLIANSSCFDKLYQPVYADEQLRRSLVFSRACLEAIANESLDINPGVLISNDWITAPIPALHALDPRYQSITRLRSAKITHMIHNGGADYHGRLPLHFGDEDLWPMFGLAPEHFFGFKDPHSNDLLNLTMAASRHAGGGVITVSAPYAESLTTPGGGDGLELVLANRKSSVYGLSNGISRMEIDRFLSEKTGYTAKQLANPLNLLSAKREMLVNMQREFGLKVNSNLRLLSFVGRLAEQKGLDLLSGTVEGTWRSTLEELLTTRPDTQIIIAGPVTQGDRSAESLRDTVRYLSSRYPGRIAAMFDYISHETALKIIASSSLFLMPSRFEPGGITQLEALAVGTPVVGRNVGGISATIDNFNPETGLGTGFLCDDYSPTAFANTTKWALSVCDDPKAYCSVVQHAISARHSWADRAPAFLSTLQGIVSGS